MSTRHANEKKIQSFPFNAKCYFVINGYFFLHHSVYTLPKVMVAQKCMRCLFLETQYCIAYVFTPITVSVLSSINNVVQIFLFVLWHKVVAP